MKKLISVALWLILSGVTGFAGFRYGIDTGARVTSELFSQAGVGSSIAQANISLSALAANDVASAHKQSLISLYVALLDLGTYADSIGYWRCYDRHRQIIQTAKIYISTHPISDLNFQDPLISKGLKVCDRK